MTTSTAHHLPQELLDRFVDDLGEEYLNSFTFNYGDQISRMALQACLSVSRSFHDRAAIYLFRQVLFTDKAGREMSTRFSLLREIMPPSVDGQIPGIASYIKRFTLILNGLRPSPRELYQEENEGQQDVIKNLSNEELSAILRDLRSDSYGIEILVIRITTMRNVKWTILPPHFQSAMLFLIRSPHLTSLQLHKFSRLPPTLLNGTTLKDVRLEQLDMSDREAPESPVVHTPETPLLPCPKLEVFQTDNAFPVDFDPITSPLTQLKKLKTYSLLPDHYRDTRRILELACHSLEVIRLDFSGDIDFPSGTINIESIPNLRFLTIMHFRSFGTPFHPTNDTNTNIICEILNTTTPLPKLTELDLEFHFNEVNVHETFLHPHPHPTSYWQRLDRQLTGGKYPSLEKFKLELSCDIILENAEIAFDKKSFLRTTRARFREAFPRICASEKIEFEIVNDASVIREGDNGGYSDIGGSDSDSAFVSDEVEF
ncbi:hypothetical protein M413DRAFT_192833 [Hebeloma cylindrosporum]|uniref:F-box domain-containing protein n=1 Tax=Hebeloma cylindrosporum TaxID=76867 RepID=A0A0C2YES5_HEBCY|nr:hypothetical protein M413DRAFT_192833 [Hebeloma cylindrosporum h7]